MKVHEVKNSIIESFHENNNPHAFLVSTNNLDKCYSDIYEITRIINCSKDGEAGCECPACKLINAGTTPDIITVEPDGKEIKISSIERIMNTFVTKPLVNKYQVYIIKEADKLNMSSANKILKFLEEPSPGIIGFLITNNPSGILPTIRSRCTLFNFNYEFSNMLSILDITEDVFDKYYTDAMQIVFNLENDPKYKVMIYLKEVAKKERNDILAILNLVLKIYIIKFENTLHSCYNNLEFIEQIIGSIQTSDELLLANRIETINGIIKLINRNANKDLALSRLAVVWE
jgi:hypothetical protein